VRPLAITRRIVWQLIGDKRTLAMIFVAPVVVLGLLSIVFNGKEYKPKIAAVDLPPGFAQALGEHARVTTPTADEADRQLRAGEIDAVLRPGAITVEGSDPSVTRSTMLAFSRLRASGEPAPAITYLHGSAKMSSFDNFGPVLLGFLIFFFTFIVAGVSFVRERTTGTLERMLATPVRRWEVVLGYLLGFAGVVAIQTVIIALFAVYVLHMMLVGSLAVLLLVVLLLAASALTLGMFLSAWARSEFQVVQFIPLVVIPQIFFSGLFPMETMHPALRALGRAMPLSYAADALRAVMIRGDGFAGVGLDLLVLAGCSAVFLVANVAALRKLRTV
jgi:ABC-2 type transport system permease protein